MMTTMCCFSRQDDLIKHYMVIFCLTFSIIEIMYNWFCKAASLWNEKKENCVDNLLCIEHNSTCWIFLRTVLFQYYTHTHIVKCLAILDALFYNLYQMCFESLMLTAVVVLVDTPWTWHHQIESHLTLHLNIKSLLRRDHSLLLQLI